MSPDDRFRYVLMAVLLLVMTIGAVHRLRAGTGERLDRKQEGLFVMIALRLSGLASFVVLVAYLINPASIGFSTMPLPNWLRWFGVALGCLTGILLFWTLHSLGRNLTDTVATRKQHTLVTTGPYRWVRHPFYICAALLFLSTSLLSANALFLITGGLVLSLLALRTPIEERHLLNRFGDEYRGYIKRTGRFFPRFRGRAGGIKDN